jgi:UDP-N-acetylglucosamine 4,6-dehydratase/5-epimerase
MILPHSSAHHTSPIAPNTRVLVTGAGGSIGTALVTRLLRENYTVCALDHDEDGLFKLQQEFSDFRERLKLFIGDVRDVDRVRRAMDGVDLVFHCAALKHVYSSEYNPFEAVQTNVLGANNVIRAALEAEVPRVVFTSSDKAVNPSSTMGATKLLGERLFVAGNHHSGSNPTRFACVRFGNVLNSNGSVLQIFARQRERGEPLTVTSPLMTRFFLSMTEAVDLVLDAANRMFGGEIFVRSMGCCDIMSLARAMSGTGEDRIREIGLKAGEKIYEELVTEDEAPRTVRLGNTYIILPSTMDMLPEETRERYAVYDNLPRLTAPLRSDEDLMSEEDVRSKLWSAGVELHRPMMPQAQAQ